MLLLNLNSRTLHIANVVFFTLCCLNSHAQLPGILDASFGLNGKVATSFGVNFESSCPGAEMQPDGKILQLGLVGGGVTGWAVVRYNTDGSLDNSFGNGGKSFIQTPMSNVDFPSSIKVLPTGKILLAGLMYDAIGSNGGIVKLNSNGSIDQTFGTSGFVKTNPGAGGNFFDMEIQSDGKIICVGEYGVLAMNNYSDFAIVRYKADGTLDNTFSNDGIQNVDFGGYNDFAYSVFIQADGKIIVTGASNALNSPIYDIAAVRLQSNGSLDLSFGSNGKILTSIKQGQDFATDCIVQSDGNILIAGISNYDGKDHAFVMRYLNNGTLDNTFGNNGISEFISPLSVGIFSISLQSNGKIIISGNAKNGNNSDFFICRFNTNGVLDQTFGNAGFVTTNFGTDSDVGRKSLIQADGKLVISGTAFNQFAIARYLMELNVGLINPAEGVILNYIYPNPVKRHFVLEYELLDKAPINICLIDLSGRQLKTIVAKDVQPIGKHKMSVDLDDDLIPGTYFLNVKAGNRLAVIKILKQ